MLHGGNKLLLGWQDRYTTSAVPNFNRDAIHILLGLGNGGIVIVTTNDDRGPLNVALVVHPIEAVLSHRRQLVAPENT
jgi:hypothetical protein